MIADAGNAVHGSARHSISSDGHSIGFPRAAPIAAERRLAEDEAVEEDGEDREGDVDVEPVAFAGEAEN